MCYFCCFFFFKQKTAYEMRISDWSSDVCSSDLRDDADAADALFGNRGQGAAAGAKPARDLRREGHDRRKAVRDVEGRDENPLFPRPQDGRDRERKSVV